MGSGIMHIIIAGAARAGKTTLSLMLNNEGFTHYKMDSIKRGICEAYNLEYDSWDEVSTVMSIIINRIIEDNKTDTNFLKEKYLFDIPFIYPKDLSLINTEDTLVIFLGYAKASAAKHFLKIRNNDASNLWTSKLDDETLSKNVKENIEFSKKLERECKKYNIPYFDTSFNREEVLKEAKEFILRKEVEYERNSKTLRVIK